MFCVYGGPANTSGEADGVQIEYIFIITIISTTFVHADELWGGKCHCKFSFHR